MNPAAISLRPGSSVVNPGPVESDPDQHPRSARPDPDSVSTKLFFFPKTFNILYKILKIKTTYGTKEKAKTM